MPSFKDTTGREWLVVVNVAQVKRVREQLRINLADPNEGNLLEQLTDPVTFVDVLFVLCQSQAKEAGVSDVQFGESMGGDALDDGLMALGGALADFFRGPKRKIWEQAVKLTRKHLAKLEAVLTERANEIEAMAEKAITDQNPIGVTSSESPAA